MLLLGSVLTLAACSAATPVSEESTTTATSGDTTTTPAETTTTGSDPTTTSAPETTETTSGRPQAPDFTLELGEGGTYTLSEGARPVYMVFWAEW